MAWAVILERDTRKGRRAKPLFTGPVGMCVDRFLVERYKLKPGQLLTLVDDGGHPIRSHRNEAPQ